MGPTGFMGRSLLALQNQSSFQKCLLTKLCKGYLNSIFALFYFVFASTSPPRAYIRRGDLTEDFLRYHFKGLIFGGAYTWRGLFSEFYGITAYNYLSVLK